jgi:hypothetical protein
MEDPLITLRIEHAIHDYAQWKAAFDGFARVRREAGVRRQVIRRPVDDPLYLMLDLEFDDQAAAAGFAAFLEERVWSSPDSAPALAGVPRTRILSVQDDGEGRASL